MVTLTTTYQKIGTGDTVTFGGSKGYLELWAKYNSQSVANNQTNYTIEARLVVTTGYIGEYTGTTLTLSGNGISSTQSCGTGNFTSKTLGNASGTTTHASDGTNTVNCNAIITFKAWGKSLSVNGSAICPTIPRYANITKFDLSAVNETQIKFTWSASAACDIVQYSLNGGGWINGTYPTTTISNLSAYTQYSVKIRVRREDSKLWTESSSKSVTTYNYPFCSELPNFTIGNDVTLKFYNPLNRQIKIQMWSHASSSFVSDLITISGTSYTGFNDIADRLYASIPNRKDSGYNIDTWYGDHKSVASSNNKYEISGNEIPEFNNFTYKDTDTRITSLTKNNQILVNGRSDCEFKINSSDKAISKNSSTMSKYICYWGSKSNEISYSDEDVIQYVYDSSSNILKVDAIDSRGLIKTVQKTIINIPYVDAVLNEVNTERKDGVDIETYLSFKATLWNGSWNNSEDETYNNKLKYVGYRVLINDEWSDYYDISDSVLNNILIYKSDTYQTIELSKSSKVKIHSNGISGGFASGQQFTIELLIKDGNDYSTYTPYYYSCTNQSFVDDGKIGMSRYKDSDGNYHYGINTMPDNEQTLYINGNTKIINDGTDTNTFMTAERSDTNTKVSMGISSDGINHGVYSDTLKKWIVYANNTNAYLNGESSFAKEIKGTYGGIISPASWYYIGDFHLGDQGRTAIVDFYTGNGQNGGSEQNTHLKIIMKQGWTGSNLPIGITTNFTQNCQSAIKVKIKHLTATKCSLYIYLPFGYNDVNYIVSGTHLNFAIKNQTISTPTTDKESTYYNNGVIL